MYSLSIELQLQNAEMILQRLPKEKILQVTAFSRLESEMQKAVKAARNSLSTDDDDSEVDKDEERELYLAEEQENNFGNSQNRMKTQQLEVTRNMAIDLKIEKEDSPASPEFKPKMEE